MSRKRFFPGVVLAGFLVAWGVSVSASAQKAPGGDEPQSSKSFYDMARLVMTDDEAKVFKSLPDEKSRLEFIKEFWAIRDPNPDTPDNEARIEFEKRARYAALWFGTQNPYKGKDPGGPLKYTGGYSDERGRTYILLGKPDAIIFFDGVHEKERRDGSRTRLESNRWILEEWIYDRLHTYAVFRRTQPDLGGGLVRGGAGDMIDTDLYNAQVRQPVGDPGQWYLESFQANLPDILEWAKLNWLTTEAGTIQTWFKFSAAVGPLGLQIAIPVERVSVDDRFRVKLDVLVNVYKDGVKVDEIRLDKELQEDRENLFENRELRFGIPYEPKQKGDYLFDVLVKDTQAMTSSKYRVLLAHTF